MMKKIIYLILSVLTVGLMACENEELQEQRANLNNVDSGGEILPELTSGGLDFSNYIAVGPSFSAGQSDGSVFLASQNNSWPNIMSKEFAKAGGGVFKQPTMDDNYGGLSLGGNRIANPRLVFGGAGPVPLESIVGPVMVATDILNPPTGPFNNYGVPGASSFHFVAPGYGNIANLSAGLANPYAVRLTGSTPNASIIELAVAQNPSFFSLSLFGGNDVLGYATGGAAGGAITPLATFEGALDIALTALTADGAEGIVSGTPHVTDLPYFTSVPYNAVPLDAGTATAVNGAYAPYNGGLQAALAALQGTGLFTAEEVAARTISFAEGQNAVVIEDESLTDLGAINPAFAALPKIRQATVNDLLILPSASFIGTLADPNNPNSVNGVGVPLADNWVVTVTELDEIITATDAMNASVEAAAQNYGIAYINLQPILAQASSTGIVFDDYVLDSSLVFGGLVSLDGVHLTARGYALMANSFLEAIDGHYGSNFIASGNRAKAGDYPTNYSPTLQ
jgi:hypothetical protein